MLYCSDKPPVQALEMPLFTGALLTGSTFKLLVGDLVAQFAGQQERAQPADRDIAETLAEIERRDGGAAVVVAQHRAVRAVGAGAGQ